MDIRKHHRLAIKGDRGFPFFLFFLNVQIEEKKTINYCIVDRKRFRTAGRGDNLIFHRETNDTNTDRLAKPNLLIIVNVTSDQLSRMIAENYNIKYVIIM